MASIWLARTLDVPISSVDAIKTGGWGTKVNVLNQSLSRFGIFSSANFALAFLSMASTLCRDTSSYY